VYPLLLGDRPLLGDGGGQAAPPVSTATTASYDGKIVTEYNEATALHYLNVHREHWHEAGRLIPGGVKALLGAVRQAGAPAFAEWQARKGPDEARLPPSANFGNLSMEDFMAQVQQMQADGEAGKGPIAPIDVPTPDTLRVACAHCGAASGKQLKRCAGCNKAAYCGATCQKAHWKAGGHKHVCAHLKLVGKRVRLHSLSSAALNGEHAVIESFDAERGRFVVRLDGGRTVLVKPVNVELAEA
jgi:hypothetical protein